MPLGRYLTDEDVLTWAKEHPEIFPPDRSIFGTSDTQYKHGTKLQGRLGVLVVVGSLFQQTGSMTTEEPVYRVTSENDLHDQCLSMVDAHRSYSFAGNFLDFLNQEDDRAAAIAGLIIRQPQLRSETRRVFVLGVRATWYLGEFDGSHGWENTFVEKQDEIPNVNLYIYLAAFHAVVVSDAFFDKHVKSIGKPLQKYFECGGTVVIFGEHGIACPHEKLGKLFGCPWGFAACAMQEFRPTTQAQALFAPDVTGSRVKVGLSAQNLLQVPQEHAMFLPTSKPEGKPDLPPNATPVALFRRAVPAPEPDSGFQGARFYGRLAYFSACNAQKEFIHMFRELIRAPP